MAKGNILSDSFEQLVELGQSTAKQGAKQIGQTFSPLKILETINPQSSKSPQSPQKEKDVKKDGVTPLNFDKLQKNYQNQDKVKMESLRSRLFQMVKREDEKALEQKKAEEQQKKQKEETEKEQKKRQKIQQQQVQQASEEPRGKIRRSIFSHKKVAQRSQAEVKPASGKQ